jgi:hypothetical protein
MKHKSDVIAALHETVYVLTKYKWTRDTLARTKNGDSVEETAYNAACFCVAGALRKSLVSKQQTIKDVIRSEEIFGEALESLKDTCGYDVVTFNDQIARDKRQVIRLINKTIKRLEAE